mgnify:CR=1 FL=1
MKIRWKIVGREDPTQTWEGVSPISRESWPDVLSTMRQVDPRALVFATVVDGVSAELEFFGGHISSIEYWDIQTGG